jgi:hypothetical protein
MIRFEKIAAWSSIIGIPLAVLGLIFVKEIGKFLKTPIPFVSA